MAVRRGVRAKKKRELLERAGCERLGPPGWPNRGSAAGALGVLLGKADRPAPGALAAPVCGGFVLGLSLAALAHGDDGGRHSGPDGNRVLGAAGCAGAGGRGDPALRLRRPRPRTP